MKKFNLFIYFILCLLAFLALVFGKLHFLGRYFVEGNSGAGFTYGDMYDMAELKEFKGFIPVVGSKEETLLKDTKIFTLGDSFFQVALGSENFGNLLEENLKVPTFNIVQQSDDYVNVANPLIFLKKENLQKGESRVMVLESVDWRSKRRALDYLYPKYAEPGLSAKLEKLAFDNSDIEYFVRKNKISNPLRQAAKNLEYRFLNETDPRVGAFDEQSGMIFYFEEFLFHHEPKNESDLDAMAETIAQLSKLLLEQYNIKLLYLNMPSKYALYGSFANKNFVYDGFSTKLYEKLQEKSVASVDVYRLFEDYKKQYPNDWLYYPSDSHFTPVGKNLVVKAVADKVRLMLSQ